MQRGVGESKVARVGNARPARALRERNGENKSLRICMHCSTAFMQEGRGRPRKYCPTCIPSGPSASTAANWRRLNPESVENHNAARRLYVRSRPCSECVSLFVPPRRDVKTCSDECRKARAKRLAHERHLRDPSVARARWRSVGNHKRALLLRSRPHDLSPADKRALLVAAADCPLCGIAMTDSRGPDQKHLDHILPVAVGGCDLRSNVRVICRTCNRARPLDGSDLLAQAAA
jgi:hypothetical protein